MLINTLTKGKEMKKTIEAHRREILTAFMQGGSFSHNLVAMGLSFMESEHGEEEAKKVLEELREMGY